MPSTVSSSAIFRLDYEAGGEVRWYLLEWETRSTSHPHWHGETVTEGGRNADVIELLPGSTKTVDMIADNPGTMAVSLPRGRSYGVWNDGGLYHLRTPHAPAAGVYRRRFLEASGEVHADSEDTAANDYRFAAHARDVFGAQDCGGRLMPSGHRPNYFAGEEQTIEKPGIRAESAQTVLGWVFFPSLVKFQGRTDWRSQSEGDVFLLYGGINSIPICPLCPQANRNERH